MASRIWPALVAVCALAPTGCGEGAVEIILAQPSAEAARPIGATQVVVRAERADGEVLARTAVIRDGAFDLGDLPVADYVGVTVELRDDVGAIVGYGRSLDRLEVASDGRATYTVPVRRPRAYFVGNAVGVRTTDPLDGASNKAIQLDRGDRDAAFAERTLGPAGPIAAAGANLYVASGTRIFRFDSDADRLDDAPLADLSARIDDLAGTADGRWLAAATPSGAMLVEIATGASPSSGIVGAVTSVAFSRTADGAPLLVAIAGGVSDDTGCPGTSVVRFTPVPGDETSVREIPAGTGLADVAGVGDLPRVVAAGLCANAAITYDLDAGVELGRVTGVARPTAVAIARDRAWVAGTQPGVTAIDAESGVEYTRTPAFHQLARVTLVDGSGDVISLPPLEQQVYTTDEDTAVFAQIIRAKAARITALVASPTGDRVTLLSGAMLRNVGRLFGLSNVIPPMVVHGSYGFTVGENGSVVERVRTRCKVCTFDASGSINELGNNCGTSQPWTYENWACSAEPGVAVFDTPTAANDLELGAGAALFGQP